jgi:flagellar motor switch protein FliN/FliY
MAQTPAGHSAEQSADQARWLMEQWTGALAAAIESMTEERPRVEFTLLAPPEPAAAEPSGGDLCWEQDFKEIPQPSVWVTAPEATWMELGSRTLRAAGIDAAESADARNTYLEILSQSLAGVAQSLSGRLGKEVAAERGAERQQSGPAAHTFKATVRYGDLALELRVALSAALMRALETGVGTSGAGGTSAAGVAVEAHAAGAPHTMDLLLDVELAVSVSFGRTELRIKDVLKLTTGSIVELNRALSEPVEVIVNNCVVARGEVVVIDGNYGVRIHQIISRQDRLRSLR